MFHTASDADSDCESYVIYTVYLRAAGSAGGNGFWLDGSYDIIISEPMLVLLDGIVLLLPIDMFRG